MNKAIEFMTRRRSIRKFKDAPVSNEQLKTILEAAMAAPSAVAKDPWRFIVIRKRENLKTIASYLPNGGFLADAGVGLIVCGDITQAHDRSLSYMLQDCSAAIENLLLAVSALDLGACWLGVHPREDRINNISGFCRLPETVIPLAAIAIGVPAVAAEARTRYNEAFIHQETWQG
ncbi:MAG: nitroreductase family protein [Victivallales bacterium]|nr:nitroreductase family protein [Victivallales bacterium]